MEEERLDQVLSLEPIHLGETSGLNGSLPLKVPDLTDVSQSLR